MTDLSNWVASTGKQVTGDELGQFYAETTARWDEANAKPPKPIMKSIEKYAAARGAARHRNVGPTPVRARHRVRRPGTVVASRRYGLRVVRPLDSRGGAVQPYVEAIPLNPDADPYFCRAELPLTNRGDAAAAT